MNRDKERLNKRREYVKQKIWVAKNTDSEVKKLARRLFLSERTIYKDLTY